MNRIIVPITAGASAVICAVVVTLFARGQGLGGNSAASDLAPIAIITATAPVDSSQAQAVTGGGSSSSSPSSAPGANIAASQTSGVELRTYSAGDAGTVTIAFDGRTVSLDSVTPNAGWDSFVDSQSSRKLELDFVSGTRTIRLNAEVEDGGLRVRLEEGKSSGSNSGDDDSGHHEEDEHSGGDDDGGSGHSNSGRGRDHDDD